MRDFLTTQYAATIVQWNEPDDEGGVVFSAYVRGKFIVAASLALLLSALQERVRSVVCPPPLRLAA